MAIRKIIYWHSDQLPQEGNACMASVQIFVGYNQGTLSDFQQMAEEMRATFPDASDKEIRGGRVSKSSVVDGHTIISWEKSIHYKDYPGWNQRLFSDTEHRW